MKVVSTLYISLASHTLHTKFTVRKGLVDHAATIKLSPWQKLNVILERNQSDPRSLWIASVVMEYN